MLTDFHSHILPGIDDGSGSTAQSISMLRMAADQGIDRVVATPHFDAKQDDPECFLTRRAAALEQLQAAMALHTGLPQLCAGAEVCYYPGMSDSEALGKLTIAGKSCILIEMPPAPWTERMYRELVWINTKQGLTPVLAHIDRYVSLFNAHGIFRRLETLPVLVQANASFFLRKNTAPFALRLLRQDRIHLLGSDCHNLTDRAPNLGAAVQAIRSRQGAAAESWLDRQDRFVFAEE